MLFSRAKRQNGYAIITDGVTGAVTEEDSMSCFHCSNTVWMKPFQTGEAMGFRCTVCDHFCCMRCHGKGCLPMEKQLELWERSAANAREM